MGIKGAAIWSAMMNRIFGRVMVASIVEGYAICLPSKMRLRITWVKPMAGNDWD